jgi:cysteinyl-tRNA synthetase
MEAIRFFNTLSRKCEEFISFETGKASVYTCGPTVYHFAHIGNLRTYIFEDILTRLLRKAGYEVLHVMNITDVGHLQSDADSGDDKMILASAREQKTPWEIAKFYEEAFFQNCAQLNIVRPNIVCRATDHVAEIISLVKRLEENGYAYTVDGNVYFDVNKFPRYRDFGKLAPIECSTASRVDSDSRKRDQRDFVLWFSQSKYPNQVMKWESPWGIGFPGWHIECSAMAMKYLGNTIDIHCGGIDHIPVHHTNEIAQTEAAIGKKWVNYWLHGEFLNVDNAKMSKSSGEFLILDSLIQNGFEPAHYRFYCLNSHYRNSLTFSFDLLEAARKDFEAIKCRIISWQYENSTDGDIATSSSELKKLEYYKDAFWNAIANDLDTHSAMQVFRNVIKDSTLPNLKKMDLLLDFDLVLGLDVANFVRYELTNEQQQSLQLRIKARINKDFATSDKIRNEFLQQGIILNDEKDGSVQWYLVRRMK